MGFEFATPILFKRSRSMYTAQASEFRPPGIRRIIIMRKITAWMVHCYTALGLVAAAGMAVFIVRGAVESFRWVIALMVVATFIDSTDGWLARRARVKE